MLFVSPAYAQASTGAAGAGSLRQAIADACVGSTVTFDPVFFGVARTITLTTGELLPPVSMTTAMTALKRYLGSIGYPMPEELNAGPFEQP